MNSALIFAAPYGYGPASKALLIGKIFESFTFKVTIVSGGETLSFIKKYAKKTIQTFDEKTTLNKYKARWLKNYSIFVCVMHRSATLHLSSLGLASRTIFFDSLYSWRMEHPEERLPRGIACQMVQAFPPLMVNNTNHSDDKVNITKPLIWASEFPGNSKRKQQYIVVNFGGVISRFVTWEQIETQIIKIVDLINNYSKQFSISVKIIGNQQIADIVKNSCNDSVEFCFVGPEEAVKIYQQALYVITTPGVETFLECQHLKIPILFLPPMNSTQLYQAKIFDNLGFHLINSSVNISNNSDPSEETKKCIDMYSLNINKIVIELEKIFYNLSNAEEFLIFKHSCDEAYNKLRVPNYAENARKLFTSISNEICKNIGCYDS